LHKEYSPLLFVYGGAYRAAPKTLGIAGFGAFSSVGGWRRNENPLCKGLQLRFVAPTQQIEESALNTWIY
jgi:hypothetical protein